MPADKVATALAALNENTSGLHVAINDLSGAYVTLRLTGDRVRDLLAKGCSVDLRPTVFASGACAQTGLAKAGVLLAAHDADIALIVRRSFANYVLQWLRTAGAEYGIEFA
jgi:sarcosine oxidase subunit gamma